MNLLFVGDIVGRPGREMLRRALPLLVDRHDPALVIVNVENAAAGNGVTRELAEGFLNLGVDVMTTGNHVWDKREVLDYIAQEPRLLRPANFPAGVPGSGSFVADVRGGPPIAVLNLMGRIFMAPLDNPFRVGADEVERLRALTPVILVDFHAEATSEKIAMGWHLDGRVTAVIGTHTHVQTADARVLPKGTAYITDVGMTGPHDSVIGVDKEPVLRRFLTGMPARFEPASGDPRLHAVVVAADPESGRATRIDRVAWALQDLDVHAGDLAAP